MKRTLLLIGLALTVGCGQAEVDAPVLNRDISDLNDNSNSNGNSNGNANDNTNSNDNTNTNTNTNTNGNGNTNGSAAAGYDTRPLNPTCVALPRPSPAGDLELQSDPFPDVTSSSARVYTDLRLAPVDLAGSRSWFAIRQNGVFETWPEGHAGDPFLVVGTDALQDLQVGGEAGLLGLALDPTYPNASNPNVVRAYINYISYCAETDSLCSILSRFDLTLAGDGSVSSATDEEQLMRVLQPASNHNAGALLFGNDGYLYMTLGDGGNGNDPWCSGQNLGTPLGKLLRLDVHSVATGYAIPPDNPFVGDTDGPYSLCNDHLVSLSNSLPDLSRADPCPEIYAYGLRNPFRMSVDRETGWIWIGDVGQGAVEEVTAVDPAAVAPNYNLGWPILEGDIDRGLSGVCGLLQDDRGPLNTDFTAPRFVHYHTGPTGLGSRSSVVAGFVYRGTELGDGYVGRFFFGDYGSGEIWAIDDPYAPGTRDVNDLETNINTRHIGYAQDAEGELLLFSLSGPRRIALASPGSGSGFPQRLTDHPCFDSTDPREVVAGAIPYAPAAQLWSDGATKRRFFAIPDGETIDRAANCGTLTPSECEARGDWELPIGSVLIKEFAIGDTAVETRVFMRHDDGEWGAYSYAWNDEQTDAVLLDAEVTQTVAGETWSYPGAASCGRCHTEAAGVTLGLETRQLTGSIAYPGDVVAPQLATLDHIALLDPPLGDEVVAGYATPGTGVDTTEEARAYLHSNCSMCHRPQGGTNSNIVLTYDTPLADMGICDQDPVTRAWPGLTDPKLLAPGAPARSVISARMKSLVADERMPPLASDVIDPIGTAVIDAWIQSLASCL